MWIFHAIIDGWSRCLATEVQVRDLILVCRDGDGQGSLVCCSPWVAKSRTQLSD